MDTDMLEPQKNVDCRDVKIEPITCEPDLDFDIKIEKIAKKNKSRNSKTKPSKMIKTITEKPSKVKKTPKIHLCDKCSYTTTRRYDLLKHLPIHQGAAGLFKCNYCPKNFNQKGSLDSHLFNNHKHEIPDLKQVITSKIHLCQKCSYQTVRIADLKSHMISHEKTPDIEKSQCAVCGYETYRKGDFNRHFRTHSSLKPYVCYLCYRGFNEKLHLDSHMLAIHGKEGDVVSGIDRKVYECPHCPFKAVILSSFRQHLITRHTDAKPLVCSSCGKRFNLKKLLDGHILAHHEGEDAIMRTISNKIHVCECCGYRTIRLSNLKDHLKRNHNIG